MYDFGQGRYGEKRGSWTPGEWLAGILLLMTIVLGLALSLGLCYYVNKKQRERSAAATANYRRQQNLDISNRPVGLKSGQVVVPQSARNQATKIDSYTNDSTRRQQQYQQQQQQQQLQRTTPNNSLIVQI